MNSLRRRAFLQGASALALSSCVPLSAAAEPIRGRKIRLGQIGVAHAHATKLEVYRRSPDYEVVGIAEEDPALRMVAQDQPPYRGLPWMTRDKLLTSENLDVVLIETSVRDLLPAAEQAVAAGKHIHLDKPAGESLPAFRRLLDDATRQGLMVQLGYMYRYNPGFILLREILQQGWLGEIFEVHAVMSKVVDPPLRAKLGEYPGGILFELGCHVLDLVIRVLGRPDKVTGVRRKSQSSAPDNLADNMLAVLEYERAIATVKSTALEVEGFARRHLAVCGTQGTLHIEPLDDPRVRLALDRPRGPYRQGYQQIELPKYERYVGDAEDMARVLRGEKPFEFTPEHDLIVQETLLTACGLV